MGPINPTKRNEFLIFSSASLCYLDTTALTHTHALFSLSLSFSYTLANLSETAKMAFEGEVTENKQLAPFPDKIQQPQDYAEYWTMDRVIRWLDVNDFKPAIDVFKGNLICSYVSPIFIIY